VVEHQLEQLGQMKLAEDGDYGGWLKAQGDQGNAKVAAANTAMRHLGLSPIDVQAMQRGYFLTTGKPGSAKVMDMLAKLGDGMAEDILLNPDASAAVRVTGAEAQAEIDRLIVDKDFQKAHRQGSRRGQTGGSGSTPRWRPIAIAPAPPRPVDKAIGQQRLSARRALILTGRA
jgi:hypothetical protein